MIRKFLLTGAPLLARLVSQGSNTESVWGTVLTAAFTVYVNSIEPYIDDTDQQLSLCAQFHLVITMTAGIGSGVMEPSDGSEIFIVVAVVAPAAVLMAILVYGVVGSGVQNMVRSQVRCGVPAAAIAHHVLYSGGWCT
jgi:hypothetical protein